MQGSLMMDIAGTWLTAEDRQMLRQPEVGGLIIFARNIESPRQVRELCQSIRALRPDLLLAVDQEGGRVQRLRQGFLRLPAMRAIADNDNAEVLAEHCGWLMATEVLAVGLDLSFAPVLDLDHQRSAVVGSRAFEGDPQRAATLAAAFIRGMHQAGMAATGKHFPGHGWAEADSHVAIPLDERSLDDIRACDMQPFKRLVHELDAVMPAHVIYSQVDQHPAGFSRRWLQDILRGELGFEGVIFSDDLSMAGAHVVGDAGKRIEAALAAGCDMGLVCNDRASAELALSALQRLRVTAPARLERMRGRGHATTEYRQAPRWLTAVAALRAAQLLD
ncbi:beta-N-acetylhexosaminidase [Pseudomonas chengduensis]|jgi:beta-N-acetylhexosaminidase|uniref:Beta-hexosaminidase n=1 Tax=Ectopseudomonas oleovorans TaxID=301 RepID=A0AA42Q7Q3_ECTOL|nr:MULTISPECIES: beta-N-acetylhexosaminidase [Pseudomonas]MDH1279275.1 beta-N-acetylhexosaminidase [Pseudomonas chengduensis]MDH1337856.1 beta-N-acetylhexosaminidase [Pseudomonas oleovorans]MDH1491697.1 beta-N-acetylhexosaminidase [Pseudomonas oleovorans]MDH1680209.1 beta-N-acetylhexosaminidase [Pseudomonas chengduensis]WGG19799.1 beta-N-acetylhexosaminidase [Pseudomonas oleovorans]